MALALLRRTSPNLVRTRLGFSLLELKVYAASRGLGARGLGGMTLDELDRIAPAIVPLQLSGSRHYVVYRGRLGDRVLVADPSFGNRTLSEDRFGKAWANGIGFTLFDPRQPEAPNRMGAPPALFLTPGALARRERITSGAAGGAR